MTGIMTTLTSAMPAGHRTALNPAAVPVSPIPAVNVSAVPQRSPLRYPGGKTWLVPHIRAWLGRSATPPETLAEPFAGGGIVSLTAVMEGLVQRCFMYEIDGDVAAFWQAALHHNEALIAKVRAFTPTRESVERIARIAPCDTLERGFRTLVLNRTRRGGILAAGAALTRSGENGKGVASRWYPDTIEQRLRAIADHRTAIDFRYADGMSLLEQLLSSDCIKNIPVFVDPPYTAGGKRAGQRLYNHNWVDHTRLFAMLADRSANFLMTYDESPEILELIAYHHFHAVRVVMKNTHHAKISELVITPGKVF